MTVARVYTIASGGRFSDCLAAAAGEDRVHPSDECVVNLVDEAYEARRPKQRGLYKKRAKVDSNSYTTGLSDPSRRFTLLVR